MQMLAESEKATANVQRGAKNIFASIIGYAVFVIVLVQDFVLPVRKVPVSWLRRKHDHLHR